MSNIVKVVGISNEISNHIVALVTRSVVQFATAPIVGVVVEYNALAKTINFVVTTAETQYQVAAQTDAARRFSEAMDSIENDPNIRDDVKRIVIPRMLKSLQLIVDDIGRELVSIGA